MQSNRVMVAAAFVVAVSVLWVSPALAGGVGQAGAVLGGVGGSQFSALSSIKSMLTSNIAMIASIGILALGLAFAFSKGAWMEIVGGLAALIFLLVAVGWAANNTSTFFGSGGLLLSAGAGSAGDERGMP